MGLWLPVTISGRRRWGFERPRREALHTLMPTTLLGSRLRDLGLREPKMQHDVAGIKNCRAFLAKFPFELHAQKLAPPAPQIREIERQAPPPSAPAATVKLPEICSLKLQPSSPSLNPKP